MASPESGFDPYTEVKKTLTVATMATGKLVTPIAEGLTASAIIFMDSKFRGNRTYHMLRPLIHTKRSKDEESSR